MKRRDQWRAIENERKRRKTKEKWTPQKQYEWFRSRQSMKCLKRTSLHWNQIFHCTFVIYSLELKSICCAMFHWDRYFDCRQEASFCLWKPLLIIIMAAILFGYVASFSFTTESTWGEGCFSENSIWLLLSHLKHMLIKNKCVQSFFKELQYLFFNTWIEIAAKNMNRFLWGGNHLT